MGARTGLADFDLAALRAALDERRVARGLTWAGVLREINAAFGEVPARAIGTSTVTGLGTRRVAEADGVLQMLRWLGRTPESFVSDHPRAADAAAALPELAPDRILRFDTRALHAALDAQRSERGLTWKRVADEIGGVTAENLTQLARGGRTSFPQVLRITLWLDRPAAVFTRSSAT